MVSTEQTNNNWGFLKRVSGGIFGNYGIKERFNQLNKSNGKQQIGSAQEAKDIMASLGKDLGFMYFIAHLRFSH